MSWIYENEYKWVEYTNMNTNELDIDYLRTKYKWIEYKKSLYNYINYSYFLFEYTWIYIMYGNLQIECKSIGYFIFKMFFFSLYLLSTCNSKHRK